MGDNHAGRLPRPGHTNPVAKTCSWCHGQGVVAVYYEAEDAYENDTCPTCWGLGEVESWE